MGEFNFQLLNSLDIFSMWKICVSFSWISVQDSLNCILTYKISGYLCALSHVLPCFSMEDIELASQDAVNGSPSRRPIIEMTIPSVLDKTLSPSGTSMFFILM